MTVPNGVNSVTHVGNGATTIWPFTFMIPAGTEQVTLLEIATGVEGDPLSDSLYTITGEDDPNGGTVTYPLSGSALASTHKINIKRIVDIEQPLNLTDQSAYDPETLEGQLDQMIFMISQLNEQLSRALLLGTGSATTPDDIIDGIADAIAEIEDLIEQAQAIVDEALEAIGTVTGELASAAFATANYHPTVAPTFLRVAGDVSTGDFGHALYKFAAAEPSHNRKFSILLEDALTVAWYEGVEYKVTPQMFGVVADGTTDVKANTELFFADTGTRKHIPAGNYEFSGVVEPTAADMHVTIDPSAVFETSYLEYGNFFTYQGDPVFAQEMLRKSYDTTFSIYDNIFAHVTIARNTGAEAATVAVYGVGEAHAAADGIGDDPRVWGGNLVAAGFIDQAQGIGLEVNVVMVPNAGETWREATGVLIASAGFAPPDRALQIHSNASTSVWENGIVFHNRVGTPAASGSLIYCDDNDTQILYGINIVEGIFTTAEITSRSLLVDGGVTPEDVVNRLRIRGAVTGSAPLFIATGSDANISMQYATKGTGDNIFSTDGGAVEHLRISHTAAPTASAELTGGAGAALLKTRGSAADSDFIIMGKGTGGGRLRDGAAVDQIRWNVTGVGFFATAPIAKPTVTGSKGGNAALTSLMTALAGLGLVTNSTT